MTVHEGSGNVFADLGLPNPEERLVKAAIVLRIANLIKQAGWTQQESAERMRLSQPDVSNIMRGRVKGFTLDRLFECLTALDQDVEITVRPKDTSRERGKVMVACP